MRWRSIAIDGPIGAGKSTIAKHVARRLGFAYADTGALYRGLGLYCLRKGVDLGSREAVESSLKQAQIYVRYSGADQLTFLNGEDITQAVRTQEVADAASRLAVVESVRFEIVKILQDIAIQQDIVMDGRDIGTVVLPKADLKIYLDASVEERAERRLRELEIKGVKTNYERVLREVLERDERDKNREASPLKVAQGAVVVDTTSLGAQEVTRRIVDEFQRLYPTSREA